MPSSRVHSRASSSKESPHPSYTNGHSIHDATTTTTTTITTNNQRQHRHQKHKVGRKRSHNEITMKEPDDDSNDSLELAARFPEPSQCPHGRPAPYSHEPSMVKMREEVDYSIRFTLEEAMAGKTSRPVRVYAEGIYDLFHTGHARQLLQAKTTFPNSYLIVGVTGDELTHRWKGRTVMADTERYEAIRHCRYVDEVVWGAPWSADLEFVEKYKIDFVAHDDVPYFLGPEQETDLYKIWKDRGMFLATERTEGVSTTDVITRIIKDYDVYIRRNLSRGLSHKELNVSYMKAKHLKLKDNYQKLESKLKDKGKNWMGKWKEQVGKYDGIIHRWEEKSKEFIGSFVDMFGKEGRLGQWFQDSTSLIGRAISPSPSNNGSTFHSRISLDHRRHHNHLHRTRSHSTSDLDPSSPPHKRRRLSPLFKRTLDEERRSDEENETE